MPVVSKSRLILATTLALDQKEQARVRAEAETQTAGRRASRTIPPALQVGEAKMNLNETVPSDSAQDWTLELGELFLPVAAAHEP